MALGDYLTIKSSLEYMNIGDAIPCRYQASSGAVGTFSELGTANMAEIPVGGSATPNGLFYFIKVDKGLLIADRLVQHSISWNTLNAGGYIEGKLITLSTLTVLIRSLTGGVAYANNEEQTEYSLTYQGWLGFPNNEWDKYIVNSDLGENITPGDSNIWNGSVLCWCKETSVNNMTRSGDSLLANNTRRICRAIGVPSYWTETTLANQYVGFRPVLQYIEPYVSTKQKTVWY